MTVARELIELAHRHGIEMFPAGDRIRLRAASPPPKEVVDALRDRKADVIAALNARIAEQWGDAAEAVAWFLGSEPPSEPFELRPAVTVLRPATFWVYLRADIDAGPGTGRDTYGAVRNELRRLYALFGLRRGDAA